MPATTPDHERRRARVEALIRPTAPTPGLAPVAGSGLSRAVGLAGGPEPVAVHPPPRPGPGARRS